MTETEFAHFHVKKKKNKWTNYLADSLHSASLHLELRDRRHLSYMTVYLANIVIVP